MHMLQVHGHSHTARPSPVGWKNPEGQLPPAPAPSGTAAAGRPDGKLLGRARSRSRCAV